MTFKHMWHKVLEIKKVLTIWYMIILTIVLVAFSSVVYLNMKKKLYQEVEGFLQIEAQQVILDIEMQEGYHNRIPASQFYILDDVITNMAEKGVYVALYDQNGYKRSGNLADTVMPERIETRNEQSIFIDEQENWAFINIPREKNGKIVEWVRLARSLEREDMTLDNLLTILFFGVPITLLIASVGGYFLAWKALNPIDQITKIAQKISHTNLSRRLQTRPIDDEIGSLTDTLNELFDRIQYAFDQQKQFTADASHELRTPVSVIKAQAEEALGKTQTIGEYQQALHVIKKQSEHMSKLISQLLVLARTDSGENQLFKEEINLSEVVIAVAEELQKVASQKSIRIKTKIQRDPIMMLVDQSKITQLILNLLDNAIEYTPDNGLVTIGVQVVKNHVWIRVKDTGIGIPPEDLTKIFKRFYRVDKARSRNKGGTGLGLSISKWIAEAHGGTITVASEPGKGSEFIVKLPLK